MKIKNFFAFGTCFEYDFLNKKFDINSNLKSQTQYSFYKILTYRNLYYKFLNSSIRFIWFRLFYFYGGEDEKNGRLIPDIKRHIKLKKNYYVLNPNLKKDFLHIDKVAKKIFQSIMSKNKEKVVNINSKKLITIKNLIYKVFNKEELKFILFNR